MTVSNINIREIQRVLNIFDNFDFTNVRKKLLVNDKHDETYCNRIINELINFLAIKVFEKDLQDISISTSDLIKQAWSYLILSDTLNYFELCKKLINTNTNDYFIHYNDDTITTDYDNYAKRYENSINSYKFYFGYDPPADIWIISTPPSASSSSSSSLLSLSISSHEKTVIPSASSSLSIKENKSKNKNKKENKKDTPKNKKENKKDTPKHLLLDNNMKSTPSIDNMKSVCTKAPSPNTDISSPSSTKTAIKRSKKVLLNRNIGDTLPARVALLNNKNAFFPIDQYPLFDDIEYTPTKDVIGNSVINFFNNKWYAVAIIDNDNNIIFSDSTAIECEIKINNFSVKYTSSDPDYKREARGVYYFTAIDKVFTEGLLKIKFKTKPNENDGANKSLAISAEPMVSSINFNNAYVKSNQAPHHSIKPQVNNDLRSHKIIEIVVDSDNDDIDHDLTIQKKKTNKKIRNSYILD